MIRLLAILTPALGLLSGASNVAPPNGDPPDRPGGLGGFGIVPTTTAPSDGASLARMDLLALNRTVAAGGEVILGVRWLCGSTVILGAQWLWGSNFNPVGRDPGGGGPSDNDKRDGDGRGRPDVGRR